MIDSLVAMNIRMQNARCDPWVELANNHANLNEYHNPATEDFWPEDAKKGIDI